MGPRRPFPPRCGWWLMRCAERVVRHRAACTVPPIVEGDSSYTAIVGAGVGDGVGSRVMTGVAVGSGVAATLSAGADVQAVSKTRDTRIGKFFFILRTSYYSCPVGAAHVRPAAVWQTTSCGKAAGRACPAPTVRQIVGGAVRIGLRGVGDAAPTFTVFSAAPPALHAASRRPSCRPRTAPCPVSPRWPSIYF